MNETIASYINILGKFCGRRDIPSLCGQALRQTYGIDQADLMVLFGGSILCGGDLLASAMQQRLAQRYAIVGGAGHTTDTLRRKIHQMYPQIQTENAAEAICFAAYLQERYGLRPDLLETRSTNCGNNITFLLELLRRERIAPRSILLIQDASMQRRMDAGFRKHLGTGTLLINYAAYRAQVAFRDGQLVFDGKPIPGMWPMDRYITLLMGEIPRLTDDAQGYGPRGRDFIAHVDIPPEVQAAFEGLCRAFPQGVRPANAAFASPAG